MERRILPAGASPSWRSANPLVLALDLRISTFGFLSDFGFRVSDFPPPRTGDETRQDSSPDADDWGGLSTPPGFLELEAGRAICVRFPAHRPCVPRSILRPRCRHDVGAGQVRLAKGTRFNGIGTRRRTAKQVMIPTIVVFLYLTVVLYI